MKGRGAEKIILILKNEITKMFHKNTISIHQ